MPSVGHHAWVGQILATVPGARKDRFMKAVDRILRPERLTPEELAQEGMTATEAASFDDLHRFPCRIRPDAYAIDRTSRALTVFEVEVGHPLTEDKLAVYNELAWWLGDAEWSLRLVAVDRFGVHREVDVVRPETHLEPWRGLPQKPLNDSGTLEAGGAS